MKKIYCKNCKYFETSSASMFHDLYFPENCKKILNSTNYPAKDTPCYKEKSWTYHKRIKDKYNKYNKNNNCIYYKRKWWKFWIK